MAIDKFLYMDQASSPVDDLSMGMALDDILYSFTILRNVRVVYDGTNDSYLEIELYGNERDINVQIVADEYQGWDLFNAPYEVPEAPDAGYTAYTKNTSLYDMLVAGNRAHRFDTTEGVGINCTPLNLLHVYDTDGTADAAVSHGSQIIIQNAGDGTSHNGDAGIELESSRASYGIMNRAGGIDDDFEIRDITNDRGLFSYDWTAGIILNRDSADIDQYLYGTSGVVCRLDAGDNSFYFNSSKHLKFGFSPTNPRGDLYTDSTSFKIDGSNAIDITTTNGHIDIQAGCGDVNITSDVLNSITIQQGASGSLNLINNPATDRTDSSILVLTDGTVVQHSTPATITAMLTEGLVVDQYLKIQPAGVLYSALMSDDGTTVYTGGEFSINVLPGSVSTPNGYLVQSLENSKVELRANYSVLQDICDVTDGVVPVGDTTAGLRDSHLSDGVAGVRAEWADATGSIASSFISTLSNSHATGVGVSQRWEIADSTHVGFVGLLRDSTEVRFDFGIGGLGGTNVFQRYQTGTEQLIINPLLYDQDTVINTVGAPLCTVDAGEHILHFPNDAPIGFGNTAADPDARLKSSGTLVSLQAKKAITIATTYGAINITADCGNVNITSDANNSIVIDSGKYADITGDDRVLLTNGSNTIEMATATGIAVTSPTEVSLVNEDNEISMVPGGGIFIDQNGTAPIAIAADGNNVSVTGSRIILYTKVGNAIVNLYDNAGSGQLEIQDSDNATQAYINSDGLLVCKRSLIGDVANGNYTETEADGTIVFNGNATVWDDMRVVPGSFDRPGVSDPAIVAYQPAGSGASTYLWEFNKDDIASFTIQLPHGYKAGANIYVHAHWTPGARGAAESGNTVGWKVDYSWANIDGTFGAMGTLDLSDACDGTDHKHQMTPDVSITGTNKNISSMLICNIKRTDTGTDDTWATNTSGSLPMLLEIDFHYEIDTVGSRTLTTK